MELSRDIGQRYKILISAYACNPARGSEEGVGWGWVRAIAGYHDLHVITAEFHRESIEAEVSRAAGEFSNVHFHYVPHKPWHYSANSNIWLYVENSMFKVVMNYAYRLWQREAYELAIKLHKEHEFDLVHQLTYVGFRFPGHLWKLDIPFVWGPVGGLENTAWRFLPVMGPYGCLYFLCRNVVNSFHKVFLSGPKKAFKKGSGHIISATEGIRIEILRWYGEDSEVICEIGPPSVIAKDSSKRAERQSFKISWSGLHITRKALPLLLKALAKLPGSVEWQLDILGQGPCTVKWKRLAVALGVSDRCIWHGWLSRNEAVNVIHESHVFVITSLYDLTSTVLLEALSQGAPVICPDHCGFSDVINNDCGIKIPVIKPEQLVSDMAEAILKLSDDESERQRLSRGALEQIKEFSWDKKAERINEIYARACSRKNAKT